jgi:hypothetical protein
MNKKKSKKKKNFDIYPQCIKVDDQINGQV